MLSTEFEKLKKEYIEKQNYSLEETHLGMIGEVEKAMHYGLQIGLKEGKRVLDNWKSLAFIVEWHNLRENPNDLPDDTYDVLDQAGYKVHYNFFQNVWVNEKDEIVNHVIAWCEIPQFRTA